VSIDAPKTGMDPNNTDFQLEIVGVDAQVVSTGTALVSCIAAECRITYRGRSCIQTLHVQAALVDAEGRLACLCDRRIDDVLFDARSPAQVKLVFPCIPRKVDMAGLRFDFTVRGMDHVSIPLATCRLEASSGQQLTGYSNATALGIPDRWVGDVWTGAEKSRIALTAELASTQDSANRSVGLYARLMDRSRKELAHAASEVTPLTPWSRIRQISLDDLDTPALQRAELELGLIEYRVVAQSGMTVPAPPPTIATLPPGSAFVKHENVNVSAAWEDRGNGKFICRWIFVWTHIEEESIAGFFGGYSGSGDFSYEEFTARIRDYQVLEFIFDGVDQISGEMADFDDSAYQVMTACRELSFTWNDDGHPWMDLDELCLREVQLQTMEREFDMLLIPGSRSNIPSLLSRYTPMTAGPGSGNADDDDTDDTDDEYIIDIADEDNEIETDQDDSKRADEYSVDACGITSSGEPPTIDFAADIIGVMRSRSWPKGFLLSPNIPGHRLEEALAAIAPSVPLEDVALWVDTTIFGHPNGMIVSRWGLHAKNPGEGPSEAAYADIRTIGLHTGLLTRCIRINGHSFFAMETFDKEVAEQFTRVLQAYARPCGANP